MNIPKQYGWKCHHGCDWKQNSQFPEPPFSPIDDTEEYVEYDFQCPKCGGAVEQVELPEDPFFAEGYESYHEGADITDCSYPEGSDGEYGWKKGWRFADKEDEYEV